ncbi:hypothetical protein [Micromonospora sp. NPDC050200]|uniref:hypothetical protein n=1 Tax=Micromonospora sp. NPDC050200 TaxID=3155664 RepID=UPI00340D6714
MTYGVIDGVYTGATAVLRIVGGYVADLIRRRKALAGIGYALSAVAKLARRPYVNSPIDRPAAAPAVERGYHAVLARRWRAVSGTTARAAETGVVRRICAPRTWAEAARSAA